MPEKVKVKFSEYMPSSNDEQVPHLQKLPEPFEISLEYFREIPIDPQDGEPLCLYYYGGHKKEDPIWMRVDHGHKKLVFGTILSIRAAAYYLIQGVKNKQIKITEVPPDMQKRVRP